MSSRSSATDARSLFAAAREDAPDADARDAVFRKIALATGTAAGAAAAASVAPVAPAASVAATASVAPAASVAATVAGAGGSGASASVFSLKVLAIGAVSGAACTALGAVLFVTFALPDAPAGRVRVGPDAHVRTVASGAKLASPRARELDPSEATARAARLADESKPAPDPTVAPTALADPPSDLAEEARLVTAARTALVAGEAARALSLVQATRKLSARALEPEELGLEARALRALGRADDAAATELVLRRRYPESALAR